MAGSDPALDELLTRAEAVHRASGPRAALAVLDAADPVTSGSSSVLYARSSLHLELGELDAAAAAARAAVNLAPWVPEYRGNLGAVLTEQSRQSSGQAARALLDAAIELLRAAAKDGPGVAMVQNNLGTALLEAGEFASALAAFDAATAADPRDASVFYNRAAVLHQLGREQEALAALDEALRLQPSFEQARVSRAHTLERLAARG